MHLVHIYPPKIGEEFQNQVSVYNKLDRITLYRVNLMSSPDEAPNATLNHCFDIANQLRYLFSRL